MTMLGLQAPLLPGEEPGLEEAEKLANDVLKADIEKPGSVPFDLVAQALAITGRWTPALQRYIQGIRPMLPREYANGLLYLIRNHPRLKRPDSLLIPNPLEAEKHFAAGLNFYFDGDYVNAEKSFLLTVENDSQDARYFYFLGLSRLAQNRRRDAAADFDEGAQLERLNRPAPAAVSESLERIQGPTRRIVNEYRYRPPEPSPRERQR
jgi:tetratricopeptide (TPR) repeat protein